jgi:hypothetical protein
MVPLLAVLGCDPLWSALPVILRGVEPALELLHERGTTVVKAIFAEKPQ